MGSVKNLYSLSRVRGRVGEGASPQFRLLGASPPLPKGGEGGSFYPAPASVANAGGLGVGLTNP
jgi:hypothetical protein